MKVVAPGQSSGFEVVAQTSRSQAATMVLAPGEKTGGPDNAHEGSDQWLFVVSGRGEATINGQQVALEPGQLVLIEAGDRHEVRAGDQALVTLNVYAPHAY